MPFAVSSHLCHSPGLHLLLEMLESFKKSNVATQFHQQYYLELMRETFVVMTGGWLPACCSCWKHTYRASTKELLWQWLCGPLAKAKCFDVA